MPALYPIIDTGLCRARGVDPLALTDVWLNAGVRLIQLRGKAEPDATLLTLADALVARASGAGARIVINDRVDIGLMSGAAGVHLGQDDLPPASVRRVAPTLVIGLSTHTREQLEAGAREPVDYLAVGPVFGTGTKDTGYDAVGLDLVSYAANRSRSVPIVAIGGITVGNARRVIDAGASAVAVISDLLEGAPDDRVRQFLATLA